MEGQLLQLLPFQDYISIRQEIKFPGNFCYDDESGSSKPEIVPPVITEGTASGSGSTCPDGYSRTEDW